MASTTTPRGGPELHPEAFSLPRRASGRPGSTANSSKTGQAADATRSGTKPKPKAVKSPPVKKPSDGRDVGSRSQDGRVRKPKSASRSGAAEHGAAPRGQGDKSPDGRDRKGAKRTPPAAAASKPGSADSAIAASRPVSSKPVGGASKVKLTPKDSNPPNWSAVVRLGTPPALPDRLTVSPAVAVDAIAPAATPAVLAPWDSTLTFGPSLGAFDYWPPSSATWNTSYGAAQCEDIAPTVVSESRNTTTLATQTASMAYLPPSADEVSGRLSPAVQPVLNTELLFMYEWLRPTPAQMIARQKLVDKLQMILDVEWPHRSVVVHPFGSSVNQLCTRNSDLDVCVMATELALNGRRRHHHQNGRYGKGARNPRPAAPLDPTKLVFEIAHLLHQHGFVDIDLSKVGARVPVVRFMDPELNLSCDINVNNPIALHNTLFIRHYVRTQHPLVVPLLVLVKYWAQRRLVNSPDSIPTYAWYLLVLYYLQQLGAVPVIPMETISPEFAAWEAANLAAAHQAATEVKAPEPVTPPVMPLSGPPSHRALAHTPHMDVRGTKYSLADLFYGFCRFFALELDFDAVVVGLRGTVAVDWDAVRTMVPSHDRDAAERQFADRSIIAKCLKLWAAAQLPQHDYRPLCIEDPMNPLRNLANNVFPMALQGLRHEAWRMCFLAGTPAELLPVETEDPVLDDAIPGGPIVPVREMMYLSRICERFTFPTTGDASGIEAGAGEADSVATWVASVQSHHGSMEDLPATDDSALVVSENHGASDVEVVHSPVLLSVDVPTVTAQLDALHLDSAESTVVAAPTVNV
ncbi:hypothetical protein AMAG_01472 [Allomyces macrogynus ATCC 38327]|uniref:Poly(A) RNA polymerase mitochondrial-like central palm domain-containing protein n=1 Tax=Allomyces macrogynus (strain ATCC 38327) TaxID=578462 RepID=A0A0L0RZR7_ALLM3|nr:hypothetical protein AMAG_01472 [Allomyces macrogynus ATCC 38327]|eukprot:KNE55581.1 hypothetical protein AMAG_01472 [Allomyces macrogynus ATCC 38327]